MPVAPPATFAPHLQASIAVQARTIDRHSADPCVSLIEYKRPTKDNRLVWQRNQPSRANASHCQNSRPYPHESRPTALRQRRWLQAAVRVLAVRMDALVTRIQPCPTEPPRQQPATIPLKNARKKPTHSGSKPIAAPVQTNRSCATPKQTAGHPN